jgi:hypothetical protein
MTQKVLTYIVFPPYCYISVVINDNDMTVVGHDRLDASSRSDLVASIYLIFCVLVVHCLCTEHHADWLARSIAHNVYNIIHIIIYDDHFRNNPFSGWWGGGMSGGVAARVTFKEFSYSRKSNPLF